MRHNFTFKTKRQTCAVVILRDKLHCHRYSTVRKKIEYLRTNKLIFYPPWGGYCMILCGRRPTQMIHFRNNFWWFQLNLLSSAKTLLSCSAHKEPSCQSPRFSMVHWPSSKTASLGDRKAAWLFGRYCLPCILALSNLVATIQSLSIGKRHLGQKNCSMFQRCNFQNSFNYRMLWLFHVKIWTSRLAINSTFDHPSSPSSSPAASCRWLKGLMPKCWVSTCTSGENTATTMHGKYSQVTQLWANFFAANQTPNNRVAWVSLPRPIKLRGWASNWNLQVSLDHRKTTC